MWTESQVFCLIGKFKISYSSLNSKTKYELCPLDKHECFKKKTVLLDIWFKVQNLWEKNVDSIIKTFFKYHIYIHSIFIQVVGCSQSHGIILSYTHISKCKKTKIVYHCSYIVMNIIKQI